MKNFHLLLTSIFIFFQTQGEAQSKKVPPTQIDIAIYDEVSIKKGDPVIPAISPANYSELLNQQISRSVPLKKNRSFAKFEISKIIETDGRPSSFVVKGSGSKEVKNELVRILGLMPKYKPAHRNGNPVRFKVSESFQFKHMKGDK